MEIHKIICDKCGKEKDLKEQLYGYEPEHWQKIIDKDEHCRSGKLLHFCSVNCVVDYFTVKTIK